MNLTLIKIKSGFFALLLITLFTGSVFMLNSSVAYADEPSCKGSGGTWRLTRPGDVGGTPGAYLCDCPESNSLNASGECISTPTSTSSPNFVKNDCNGSNIQAGLPEGNENHCGILDYVVNITNFLAAVVGLVVVGSIIYGGIQYSSSGGDPQKVSAAKKRILNSVVAMLAFIFMYSFLQYLIPGGIF